jgi:hypothetical protein
MTHQSRIDGMNHKPHRHPAPIQMSAHKDLQQIDRLLQIAALAIPVPCPQNSEIPAMKTNLRHPHDLKFAVSPMTTYLVAAPTIPQLSQFVMIGMMKMSGIN